jgi:GNAT superfamily N-acetyltransferase
MVNGEWEFLIRFSEFLYSQFSIQFSIFIMAYQITMETDPIQEDIHVLEQGLHDHRETVLGQKVRNYLAYFLRDDARAIVGGVNGNFGETWLYVNALWIREDLRGFGYGRKLLTLIENEARRNGCSKSFLNTMSYEAPEFYRKLGYAVFAELENFPGEHRRIFLRKDLS